MNPIADLTLLDYWNIIRKRKEIIILCFLIIVTTVWLYTKREKKIYTFEATATVRVEQRKPVSAALTDLVSWGTGDFMSTELETVQSYAVMELVAYKLGLIEKEHLRYDHEIDDRIFEPSGRETPDEVVRTVERLRSMVSVSQRDITNLIDITVRRLATNPTAQEAEEIAKEVKSIANTIAREYKNENDYQKNKETRDTKNKIEEMLKEYETELEKVELAERKFRQQHDFVTPDKNLDMILAQISSLEVQQTDIQLQIDQKKDELEQLREVKENPDKLKVLFPDIYNHPSLATIRSNIENLEARLTELLESATEKHPQAKSINQTVSKLKSKLNSDMQKLIDDTITSTETQIANLQDRLQKLERKINEYRTRLSEIPEEETKYRDLKHELEVNQSIYAMLKRRSEEVKIASQTVGDVTILEPAIKPRPVRVGAGKLTKILAGGVVGVLLGFVLAFLVESLDTSIGTIEDLEEYLQTSVLGVIPKIGFDKKAANISFKSKLSSLRLPSWLNPFRSRKRITPPKGRPARLIVQDNPKAPEAEAFRALRTNILLKSRNDNSVALLVTSASPQEGKSAIVSNLALAMAQLRKQTLLIDCDLRRASIHRIFGVEKEPGLTDIIVDRADFDEAIRSATDLLFGILRDTYEEVPGIDYLHVLPAGSRMPNPSEILAFDVVTDLINQLKTQYDVILLDTPPALPVTDALVLVPRVDSVLLVYRAGKSNRRIPKRAMEVINENIGDDEKKIAGVVLNDVRPEIHTTMSTTYPYYYYYKSEEKEETRSG